MTERQEVNLKLDVPQELDAHLLEQAEASQKLWADLISWIRADSSFDLNRVVLERKAQNLRGESLSLATTREIAITIFRRWRSNQTLDLTPNTVLFGQKRASILVRDGVSVVTFRNMKTPIISGDHPNVSVEFGLGHFIKVENDWFLRGRLVAAPVTRVETSQPRPTRTIIKNDNTPKGGYVKDFQDTVVSLGSYQMPADDGCEPVFIRLGRREDLIKLSLGWLMDHPQAPTAMVLGYR